MDNSTKPIKSLIGGRTTLQARLWPNGEIAIWKQKTFKPEPLVIAPDQSRTDFKMARFRLHLTERSLEAAIAVALGLSSHPIFDKLEGAVIDGGETLLKPREKKGKRGITSYGKRMVRNAAHLLEQLGGKARCVFATVTVPALPVEKMRPIHQEWGEVCERYRLILKRTLQDQGLSGEVVTVSEIQEKRYEKTGLPVLHLHSVFIGVKKCGRFAISTEQHDDMWYRALNVAVDVERAECSVGCNLQRVKKSTAAYLGKYLSKGGKAVERAIEDGFGSWLPDHWWNCSRSLRRKVKAQTRRIDFLAEWLNDVAELGGGDIWEWHRPVILEMNDGYKVTIARYGKLSNRQMAEIQAYYP
jgi:hypothetical protein